MNEGKGWINSAQLGDFSLMFFKEKKVEVIVVDISLQIILEISSAYWPFAYSLIHLLTIYIYIHDNI